MIGYILRYPNYDIKSYTQFGGILCKCPLIRDMGVENDPRLGTTSKKRSLIRDFGFGKSDP